MNTRYFHTKNMFFGTMYEGDKILNISRDDARNNLYGVAVSKFGYGSIYEEDKDRNIINREAKEGIVAILFLGKTKISFLNIKESIDVNAGDMVIFESEMSYDVENKNLITLFIFEQERKENIVGEGKILYDVIATIRDEYRIKVRANNPQEAIDFANKTPIHNWEHPDIEPHLLRREIARFARWGNLMATKIKDLEQ